MRPANHLNSGNNTGFAVSIPKGPYLDKYEKKNFSLIYFSRISSLYLWDESCVNTFKIIENFYVIAWSFFN